MTVTDNGSNFVKAFKEHGVSPDMDDIDNDLPQFENECILPKHQRCASHTLNLLATTDFLKILKSNGELDYQNNMVFQKCNALWKKCSYPKSSEVVVRVLGCSLVVPVVTRWNSLYDAVKRLLQHKEELGHLCCEVNVPQIHSGDLRYLESYVALMEPVAAALDFMQGHKEVKYGFLIPTLMTLSNKLTKFSENNEFVIFRSLVINLEKKLRGRFEPYFLLAPEANIAVAAAVLTPGIKNKWIKVLQRTNPAMTVERVNRKDNLSFNFENKLKRNDYDALFDYDSGELKLFDNGLKLDISSYSHMNIRMSTKGKRPLRSLTPSDKIHAIQRIHDGESKASVARDIGVPESTLRGWCKNEDKLRFMSRQTDKMAADSMAEKLGASAAMLGGPPEKRTKLDSGSIPFNYSNKIKYDEIMYKRSSLNGLEYGSNKSLSELGFNGMPTDYGAFSGAVKNKVYGADISRQADPAIGVISPLTSLSHLSGLSGLTQSPLAISFNELASNLNFLAQLNPRLAAMSGLNGLTASGSTLRNIKIKPQPQLQSPHSECADRQQGLSVKNWAKQKSPTSTPTGDSNYGMNLCQTDDSNNHKMKCASPPIASSLGNCLPSLTSISEDPLLYWLKSQQAMLGLSNIYPPPTAPSMGESSPPMRSPTPHQSAKLHINAPLNASASTPSSTPSVGLDDKNSVWFNWCKVLGASLNSLAPAAAAILHVTPMQQQQPPSANAKTAANIETTTSTPNLTNKKSHLENILFTQLTKNIDNYPIENSFTTISTQCNDNKDMESLNKPEDLSARTIKTASAPTSPIPTTPDINTAPSPNTEESLVPTPAHSPNESSIVNDTNSPFYVEEEECGIESIADCKDVLNNLLYKINNNPSVASLSKATTPLSEGVDGDGCNSECNISYTSDNNQNSNDYNVNNNLSNKTDEEERLKVCELTNEHRDFEAIKHGEKFLSWLEKCSNPRITATHLMQMRFLMSALKSTCNYKIENCIESVEKRNHASMNENVLNAVEDNTYMNKVRRRK